MVDSGYGPKDMSDMEENTRSSRPLRELLDTDICDWCQKEKATITDGTYVYCSEEHKKLFIANAQQAAVDAVEKQPENTKNRPQYVMYDPVAVGWDVGLDKAIEDAQRMHVPLAVSTQEHLERVRRKHPYVCVGLIER